MQKRLRCASQPTKSITARLTYHGACIEPGPFSEKKIGPVPSAPSLGAISSSASSPNANSGIIKPDNFASAGAG